jgi:signal transduction histidine kinase
MLKRRMPKFFSSIFFKLMVIILVAGVGINLAIIFFFREFRHHVARSYYPHLNRYVDDLLIEIGDPPDQDRARQIAAETDLMIAYEGKDQSWSTTGAPIFLPTRHVRFWHNDGRLQAGHYRGRHLVIVKRGDGRLTFQLTLMPDAEKRVHALALRLLLFITALMLCAYLTIRWVLKPLRWLKQGVDQVARGELTHRVPEKRSDELRDLSASFNTMTERLQHLIKSKEQLLLDVSHELRTPLTRMKVASAMMAESADRASIEEDLREMEKKITELLETTRSLNIKDSLKLTQVDVVDLIRSIAQPFTAGRPTIEITSMPDAAPIRLDAHRIRLALKNILDNGQKYSPDDALPIRMSVSIDGPRMVISIQDHGIGICQEDQRFIFEPFYRADKARSPQRDGYGLGLSLAKNIIEAHGGKITVHSELGQGTLVQVHLPYPHSSKAS